MTGGGWGGSGGCITEKNPPPPGVVHLFFSMLQKHPSFYWYTTYQDLGGRLAWVKVDKAEHREVPQENIKLFNSKVVE